MNNNYCVIMAGGIGSRFWPMSRNACPKQFLDILGTGKSLLQQTYERFLKICPRENIFVVTNDSYVHLVREQLPELDPSSVLGEPHRKNTGPCITFASYKIAKLNPAANVIVAPSDHIILKEGEFATAINKGLDFVSKNESLLTLGINPRRPDTGYGYIQFIDNKVQEENKISKVKTFTEKPNLEMANFFLQTGEFLWNAGIFMWNIQTIQKAIKEHLPDIDALFQDASRFFDTPSEADYVRKAYEQCTNISIDFGVMEKAKNVFVMSADFGWSDLGTYGSLYEHIRHDGNENAVVGKNVMTYATHNCIINVPKDKLVIIQGLEGYIVVESDNTLLICPIKDEQQIRQFVNDVKLNKGDKYV
jgi:mannose-1-phosphate guanylyltransferase